MADVTQKQEQEPPYQPVEPVLYRINHFVLSGPPGELDEVEATIAEERDELGIEDFDRVPPADPTVYVQEGEYGSRARLGKEVGRRPERLSGDGYDVQPPGESRLYAFTPQNGGDQTESVVAKLKRLLHQSEYEDTEACTDAAMTSPNEGNPSPNEGNPSPYEENPSPDPDMPGICVPSPAGLPAQALGQQPVFRRNGWQAWRRATQNGPTDEGAGVTVVVMDTFPVFGEDIDTGWKYLDYLVLPKLDEKTQPGSRATSDLECRVARREPPPDTSAPDDEEDSKPLTYDQLLPYHGTMIASVIRTIAPKARIVGVRVINNAGLTYSTDIINAMRWVLRNPIINGEPLLLDPDRVVFNLSLGLRRTQPETVESCCMFHAVHEATLQRAWFVCAAGNDSYMRHENPVEPAAYGHYWHARAPDERVIAVSGTSIRTKYAGYSNESAFAAPANCVIMDPDPDHGLNQLSDTLDGYPVVRWHGTSFATPQVAGLLALLLSSERENIQTIVEKYPGRLKQHIWATSHPPERWNGVREICISHALLGIPCDEAPQAERGGCLRALLGLLFGARN